jgi:hypothetical protein
MTTLLKRSMSISYPAGRLNRRFVADRGGVHSATLPRSSMINLSDSKDLLH